MQAKVGKELPLPRVSAGLVRLVVAGSFLHWSALVLVSF
jgi:hypothetical protein